MLRYMPSFRKLVFSLAVPALCAGGVISLSACASDDAEQVMADRPAEDIYQEAQAAMEDGQYVEATRLFEEVERLHPYSRWATEAQLMAARSSYEDQRYDEAILALDRFMELHPGNEKIDYAHYLKALSFYEQISDVRRDQQMTRLAMEAFNTLIRRYPDSQFARDARLKRDLTEDHLAGKEMEIGRYYLGRGQINAAIGRFRRVVKDYQTTTHVPEALHRLVEAYLTLGLRQEALRVAAVLGHNYPGSRWYQDTFGLMDDETRQSLAADRSWIDETVDSLFSGE
jgi:outer membrane protein assembly factor BamD